MTQGRPSAVGSADLVATGVRPAAQHVRLSWFERNERRLFLAPAVLIVLVLSIFPLFASLAISFLNWNFNDMAAGFKWVGLLNWGRLISDEHFHKVFVNTLLYVVIGVPLQYVIGLVLALVLHQEIRGRRFFRVLFLVPMMLSPVAVAYVLGRMTFNESQGPVNDLLWYLHIPPVHWMTQFPTAFFTIAIVDSWQWTPFMLLLLLAGLQGIPAEVIEAAKLDAQTRWQVFRFIIFPLLLPWTVSAILLRSVEMLKIMDLIVVITAGGPGITTESLTFYAYQTGIRNLDLGYASTISYTLLILAVAVATILLLLVRQAVNRANA